MFYRLLLFITEHHPDKNNIFWPYLARDHYSRDTIEWLDENVNNVTKRVNPPNVPQARPIENFWRSLLQKVYENGWEVSSEQQLVYRIN